MSFSNKQFSVIQLRRGLNSEFESSNIILASGEPAFATDEKVFKIGDGVTSWINLPGLIPSGSLLQFAPISSSGLASLITDETGSGLAVFNTSPALSGIPTAPTAVSGTNTNQIATTAFVRTEVSNLVDSAPEVLDTLNELAAAINDDASFYVTINNDISSVSGSIPFVINSGDNRLITSDGTNRGINAEANLTFDEDLLTINGNFIANSGTLDTLAFNTNADPTLTQGQIAWNDTEGTVNIAITDSAQIHVGEHQFFRVRNSTGDVLYKGQIVYADTVHANGIIEPQLYVADGTIREIRFLGVVLENINHNNNGYVINFGHIENITLDGSLSNIAVGDETWIDGDILYAHPTVPGKLTNVAPAHSVWVAIILDSGNNGRMFVRPTSYGHLSDVHDVSISGVTDGQFLVYNGTSENWIPSAGVSWSDSHISLTDTKGIAWPSVGSAAYIIADNGGGNSSISMGNVDTVYINSTVDCLVVNTANGIGIQGSVLTANPYSSYTRTWTLPDTDGTVLVAESTEHPIFIGTGYLSVGRNYYLPDADGTLVLADNNNDFVNPPSYLDIARIRNGSSGYYLFLGGGNDTSDHTITFPDADGTALVDVGGYFTFGNATIDALSLTVGRAFALPDADGTVVIADSFTNQVTPGYPIYATDYLGVINSSNIANSASFDGSLLDNTYTYALPNANGTVVLRDNTTLTDAYIDQYGVLQIGGGVAAGLQITGTDSYLDITSNGLRFSTNANNTVTFINLSNNPHVYDFPDHDGAVVVENYGYITNAGMTSLTTPSLRLDTGVGGNFTSLEAYATTDRTITFPDADGTVLLEDSANGFNFGAGTLVGDYTNIHIEVANETWVIGTAAINTPLSSFSISPYGEIITPGIIQFTDDVNSVTIQLGDAPSATRIINLPDADGTVVVLSSVPTLSTDPGVPGQIATDGTDLYICVATDTWKKTTLSTF